MTRATSILARHFVLALHETGGLVTVVVKVDKRFAGLRVIVALCVVDFEICFSAWFSSFLHDWGGSFWLRF
jgi:hypothetical protein